MKTHRHEIAAGPSRAARVAASALVVLVLPALAAAQSGAADVTAQLGGTILALTPEVAYERALLRVPGRTATA